MASMGVQIANCIFKFRAHNEKETVRAALVYSVLINRARCTASPQILAHEALRRGFLQPLLACFGLHLEREAGGLSTARNLVSPNSVTTSASPPLPHPAVYDEKWSSLLAGSTIPSCTHVRHHSSRQ
jgi:hypothetical protein